jgi:hypothetical protein
MKASLAFSRSALQKHYVIEGVAQVAQTHYQMAKSGKHAASTIHYLDKHPRWLEGPTLETQPAAIPDFIVVLEKKVA